MYPGCTASGLKPQASSLKPHPFPMRRIEQAHKLPEDHGGRAPDFPAGDVEVGILELDRVAHSSCPLQTAAIADVGDAHIDQLRDLARMGTESGCDIGDADKGLNHEVADGNPDRRQASHNAHIV